MRADEHDTGGEQRSDETGCTGAGTRGRALEPLAARGQDLGLVGAGVLIRELRGVPPHAVLRREKRSKRSFVLEIVEVVTGFDHGERIQTSRLSRVATLLGPGGYSRRKRAYDACVTDAVGDGDWLTLTGAPLSYATALEWVGGPGWGAVAGFAGLVRDHAEGRTGVTAIDYEAYEEHVVPRFRELAASARELWPELRKIVIWHRVGRVAMGEPSVVIAVSSPHRREAFDACRYLIDTLKAAVPIWKREHWPGGAEWSPAAHGLEPVFPPRGGVS